MWEYLYKFSSVEYSILCVPMKRLCKRCGCEQPIENFPAGKVRYICKYHIQQRYNENQENVSQKVLKKIQHLAYIDRKLFKVSDGFLQRKVLSRMLEERLGREYKLWDKMRVVPADPTYPLSDENAVIVSAEKRRMLYQAWKGLGVDVYAKLLLENT